MGKSYTLEIYFGFRGEQGAMYRASTIATRPWDVGNDDW